jgi:hypothetical protein
VSLAELQSAPISLTEGDHVNVAVTATNYYGESPSSVLGDGASIWVIPDAPVSLSNNALITDASRIGLTWYKSPSNGGTPVLDYRLFYALENDEYVELATGILPTSYVTTVELIDGERYKFKA